MNEETDSPAGTKHKVHQAGARPNPVEAADFQIVSPPFACGVTWLVNALLCLEVKTTNASFETPDWQPAGAGWTMPDDVSGHLRWHLPVLHDRQTFHFPEAIEVRWEHRLDLAASRPRPTIFFVRDPRDAIYSLYCRNYADDYLPVPYLNRPNTWPEHFPALFELPPFETFAYFSYFWLAMGSVMPLKVVRFEDIRKSPDAVLRDVLGFLGVQRSAEQIAAAVRSSSFENAKRAMRTMEQETGREFLTARKGQAGEWTSVYSPAMRRCIRKSGEAAIEQFGYAGSGAQVKGAPAFEDSSSAVRRHFSGKLREISQEALQATERGASLPPADAAALAIRAGLSGTGLLRFASVMMAVFYVLRTFPDTSAPAARAALGAFVNLNLDWFDQWPVQVAAWRCLQGLERESGIPLLSQMGWWWNYKMKRVVRQWET